MQDISITTKLAIETYAELMNITFNEALVRVSESEPAQENVKMLMFMVR